MEEERSRFVSYEQEFQPADEPFIPVTARDFIETFGMADEDEETQRVWLQEIADWARAANTPSSPVLRQSMRNLGVHFPEPEGPRVRDDLGWPWDSDD